MGYIQFIQTINYVFYLQTVHAYRSYGNSEVNRKLESKESMNFDRGGLVSEEEQKSGMQAKKLENWEEQLLHQQPPNGSIVDHVKHENSANGYNMYSHENAEFHATKPTWSQMMPVSSPTSCVTTLSSNMLDFSSNKSDGRHPLPDRSSEVQYE